jgi:hypothetical protein
MAAEPEKRVFDATTSDDAVLEQLGYTQGTLPSIHLHTTHVLIRSM